MKMDESTFKYKSYYNVADVLVEVNFQTSKDLLHFSYYYNGHKSIKFNEIDIKLYFQAENMESFFDCMKRRKGEKKIYYKKQNETLKLYETFTYASTKPSIFPPVIFTKDKIAFHSSSLSYQNKSFMLLGKPYSGKSIFLLSICSNKKFKFLSDDISILDLKKMEIYPFLRPIGLRLNTVKKIKWLQEINVDDCIIIEMDNMKKIIASPFILPIKIAKKPSALTSVFFLNNIKKGFSIKEVENITAYTLMSQNMHINNLNYEYFKTRFHKIKFFEVSHDFSNINKISQAIINKI